MLSSSHTASIGAGMTHDDVKRSAIPAPQWSAIVCTHLDTVFQAAGAGLVRSLPLEPADGTVEDMLWETRPEELLERYPDSRIVESYGLKDPPLCIDFWIYLDVGSRRATLSAEGLGAGTPDVESSGDGVEDAQRLEKVSPGRWHSTPEPGSRARECLRRILPAQRGDSDG